MDRWQSDVREFNQAIGARLRATPGWCSEEDCDLAWDLIIEEYDELIAASDVATRDLPETVDAILDLIYVLLGFACRLGADLGPLWAEVHRTNMAKLAGPRRADGKLLKPEGWQPPRIAELLREQGWAGAAPRRCGCCAWFEGACPGQSAYALACEEYADGEDSSDLAAPEARGTVAAQ